MESYQTFINKNKEKNKCVNTESNLKIKEFPFISTLKGDIVHKFNYRLFKFNEINKNRNINKYFSCNKDDLFSNIKIRNLSINKKSIKNLKELKSNSKYNNPNNNYIETMDYFYSEPNSVKNSKRSISSKIFKNKYFSPQSRKNLSKMAFNGNTDSNRNQSLDRMISLNFNSNINKNNINLCLVPIFYKYKKRNNIIYNNIYKNTNKNIKNLLFNNKLENNNNAFNKNLLMPNTSYKKNNRIQLFNRTKNNFKIKVKNETLDSKGDENDMETKVRINNFRKELLQETLKINRMFTDFNKQITDKIRRIKIKENHMNVHKIEK